MAKARKKTVKIYTCKPEYLLNSIFAPQSPVNQEKLVIDFSLSEEIAKRCIKLGLEYVGCSSNEKQCVKLKKKLGFKDSYMTGL